MSAATSRNPDLVLTRRAVAAQAAPIILASASVPMLGMVDTAVMGHYGSAAELGALALGALLFNFLYWGFGFLRMATTGFVAQAHGSGQLMALRAAAVRPLFLGLGIGVLLWGLHTPLVGFFHLAVDAGPGVSGRSSEYVSARIWGAPAALALYALCGTLIGLGQGRALLAVQLLLNGLNAVLDIWLGGYLGMGLRGIGYGTAVAEWVSALLALWLVWRGLGGRQARGGRWLAWSLLAQAAAWRAMWTANTDLLLRTVGLLAGFAWFARLGGQLGDTVLAANHLLLQLVAFSAFFLDGFAHVAEARVGHALGRGDRPALQRGVRLSSELAVLSACLLALAILLAGPLLLGALSSLPAVVTVANAHLPWAAVYVLVSVAAFQLDGICIGATATAPMRRSVLWALLVFALMAGPAVALWGNHGLWAAMVVYVLLRGVLLWPTWPRLLAAATGASGRPV